MRRADRMGLMAKPTFIGKYHYHIFIFTKRVIFILTSKTKSIGDLWIIASEARQSWQALEKPL